MADAGAGIGGNLDILVIDPDAVAHGHVGAKDAQVVQMVHGGLAGAAAGIFLLIGRLQHMHVHGHPGLARFLRQGDKAFVAAPV